MVVFYSNLAYQYKFSLLKHNSYVVCAYGPILITSDMVNPFLPFFPTFYFRFIEGFVTTFEEYLDPYSPS